MHKNWKYIAILVFCFFILLLAQANRPKQFNWLPTYSKYDKNPYGTYILYDLLQDVFPNKQFETVDKTIYEIFEFDNYQDFIYIFIADSFTPDDYDVELLLDYVYRGGCTFIAANYFTTTLTDTLEIDVKFHFPITGEDDSLSLNFVDRNLKATKNYLYNKGAVDYYLADYNNDYTEVLGVNSKGQPTFVKISIGDGYLFLNTNPMTFTNYYMLKRNNAEYVAKCFSFLPVRNILWDEYFKIGRTETGTPLRFILSKASLKWALYLTLFLFVVFVAFEVKRKQRMIPIVDPMRNTTLEFTETIGRLYFQRKTNLNIAQKLILYFFEYLRSQLFLEINSADANLVEKVAHKSGVPTEEVASLFKTIQYIQSKEVEILDIVLINLNKGIERFKEQMQ
ncbi:MAG: DUF4350 domain-containing protein [Thermonemataceae bacterium]